MGQILCAHGKRQERYLQFTYVYQYFSRILHSHPFFGVAVTENWALVKTSHHTTILDKPRDPEMLLLLALNRPLWAPLGRFSCWESVASSGYADLLPAGLRVEWCAILCNCWNLVEWCELFEFFCGNKLYDNFFNFPKTKSTIRGFVSCPRGPFWLWHCPQIHGILVNWFMKPPGYSDIYQTHTNSIMGWHGLACCCNQKWSSDQSGLGSSIAIKQNETTTISEWWCGKIPRNHYQ